MSFVNFSLRTRVNFQSIEAENKRKAENEQTRTQEAAGKMAKKNERRCELDAG